MQFVLVFGTNYYYANSAVPTFVQHFIQWGVNRYGNDFDTSAPMWIRKKADRLMKRFGLLNV